jgi:hypothetical protein
MGSCVFVRDGGDGSGIYNYDSKFVSFSRSHGIRVDVQLDGLVGPPSGFTPNVFTIYSNWASSPYPGQQSVARGEAIFNTQPLVITDVRGLNDELNEPTINGTCTTCHDTPTVGDHSLAVPLEIGTSRTASYETDPTIQAAVSQLSMPTLPIFQVVCNEGPDLRPSSSSLEKKFCGWLRYHGG